MSDNGFCHLHCHDEYSPLDGLGTVDECVECAAELGFPAMAQTNHGNIDGFLKFKKACTAHGIKPIYGVELYYVDDLIKHIKGEKRRHLTLLIKNSKGFQSVNRILTKAHLDGFYYRPRADKGLILDNTEGLIALSGCASGPLGYDGDEDFVFQLAEAFGDDFYLEIMPLDFNLQHAANAAAYVLCNELNVSLVATNDVHYPREEDAILHEVLLAIQSKARWDDKKRWKFGITGLYQKTADEMAESFAQMSINPFSPSQIEEAIQQTAEVADKCELELRPVQPSLPDPPLLRTTGQFPSDLLMALCVEGYEEMIEDDPDDVYWDRMVHELAVLKEFGFERYFLVVHDFVRWCKEHGIMVGPGRGSVGGSLVARFLGITVVDPIKYGLMFERFISPGRIDLPDIDIDVEKDRRDEAIGYLKEAYGEDHVAQVTTFGKMLGRTALRDVARVFSVPYRDVDKAAKAIPDSVSEQVREGHTIEDAFETFEDGKRFKAKYPEVTDYACRLEGQVRHHGRHPAGVVISSKSFLDGEMGHLTHRGSDAVLLNWDKYDLEHFGLVKLDALGLANLSVLNRCRELVKENHGVNIEFEKLEPDEPEVFERFGQGQTVSIFQFGSRMMRKLCPSLGISDFDDLCRANALVRPGPLRGGITDSYRKRKKGFEEVAYPHSAMREFTEETCGLIIYQEQVMQLLHELAGLPWKTADSIRKVIGSSMGLAAFKGFERQFVDGCGDKGTLSREAAKKIFELLKYHGAYSFNKAHSVEYSLLAYWEMWTKLHYPTEYMAALLSVEKKAEKVTEYVKEAGKMGLEVALPSLNESHSTDWTIGSSGDGSTLICPLLEIKGVGERASAEISRVREERGKIKTLKELQEAVNRRACNARVIKALEAAGALDELEDVESKDRTLTARELLPWEVVNPFLDYETLIAKLSEALGAASISEVKSRAGGGEFYIAGRIAELELKYSKKVKEGRSASSGEARALAVLESRDDFINLMFDKEVFRAQKETVEHLDSKFALLRGTTLQGRAVVVRKIWLLDDLLMGNFGECGGLPLMGDAFELGDEALESIAGCEACELCETCKRPVPWSPGELPVMILGEAPGGEEEKDGMGFTGPAGKFLWKTLGVEREMFHVTNVVHCRPPDNRSPNRGEVRHCSSLWLDFEIEELEPWIIFALGNTPLFFFTGRDTGISSLNATVEWSSKYECWVAWGIHPAAALHDPSNKQQVEDACQRFLQLIVDCLGG